MYMDPKLKIEVECLFKRKREASLFEKITGLYFEFNGFISKEQEIIFLWLKMVKFLH